MKSELVPLPAPGAPPSRINSLGKRIRLRPNSRSSSRQMAPKDELRILDLQIRRVRCGAQKGDGSLLTLARADVVILGGFHASASDSNFSFATKPSATRWEAYFDSFPPPNNASNK